MRVAGKQKRRYFLEQAKEWFESNKSTMFFGDVKSIAIRAVAEYIANQEGMTLYSKIKEKDGNSK